MAHPCAQLPYPPRNVEYARAVPAGFSLVTNTFQSWELQFDDAMVSFYDYSTKKSSIVFRLRNTGWRSSGSYSVSPDGKSILYARVDQSQTNLMLVDNFK